MAKSNVNVFYRVIKAERGHPFSGLYAVEKIFVKDGNIYKKEIVHEWDLRIISEAVLAKLGGSAAFEAYKEENDLIDELPVPGTQEIEARTAEDLKDLTKNKLVRELKFKEPK